MRCPENGQWNLLCRHIGHSPFEESCWIHVRRQCYSWVSTRELTSKSLLSYHMEWVTAFSDHWWISRHLSCHGTTQGIIDVHRVQSSPGYLHVGQVPSNWTRHIPQTSSSGMSQRHEATAFHSWIVTFMVYSTRQVAELEEACLGVADWRINESLLSERLMT